MFGGAKTISSPLAFTEGLFYLEKNILKKKKAPQQNAKGLEIVRLPQQNDFRTFCMSDETEKVYQKLEEVINT